MKKGESADVSLSWWKRAQPKGLKNAGKLESALDDYEKAKKAIEKGDGEAAKAALDALGMIDSAAKAVADEAGKAKGDEMQWTADCLKKMGRLTDAERKWVEDHAEGDDDGMFSDEEVYRDYLLKGLKRLRSAGEMNFGMVLGKKAENHRMALHKSKSPKALGSMLVKETSLHMFTFGTAIADGDEGAGVLQLHLADQARQLPGLAKKGSRMLKKFKPLPFTKLRLFVGGQEVQDLDDPEDSDSDDDETQPSLDSLKQALRALIGRVQTVSDAARKGDLARMASQANAALTAQDAGNGARLIEALRTALDTAPSGTGTSGNGTAASSFDAAKARVGLDVGRKAWLAARKKVEEEIEKLRKEIVTTYEPSGLSGELEPLFRSRTAPVLQTLSEDLATALAAATAEENPERSAELLRQVKGEIKKYQDYINGEELITMLDDNPFTPLAIRKTVSATLDALSRVVR